MQNVFTESTNQVNPLDNLVGPGKKFASVDELAKSYEHGQNHIATLEAEHAEWRAGIQANIENQRQQSQTPSPSPVGNEPAQRENEVNLDDRIREAIAQTERDRKLSTNIDEVSKRLVEVYGDAQKANEAVRNRATELGVSIEFLMDAAAQSPKAFYAQIGLNDTPRQVPAPRSSVNPEALNTLNPNRQIKPGTYSYYEEMRKTNPRLYNSPKIQLQMHNEALTAGESFYT